MNTDVEFHIRQNYPWNKLPANVKQVRCVSRSQGERGAPLCPGGGGEGEPVNVTAVLSVIQAAVRVAPLANLLCAAGSRGFTGATVDHHYITAIGAKLPLPNLTGVT